MHRYLILLMCNLPWNWSTDYTNQTALELSKNNLVICYMLTEALSLKEYIVKMKIPKILHKKGYNLFFYVPIYFVPFRRFKLITNVNNYLNILLFKIIANLLALNKKLNKKILWVFDPQYYSLYNRFCKKYFLLYDCVDYFSEATSNKKFNKFVKQEELKLLKSADWVFTISHTLKKLHQKIRPDIQIVPQGFRLEEFKDAYLNIDFQLPTDKPIIGYIGAINYRLDFDLLISLVKKTASKYSYVFAGQIQDTSDSQNIIAQKIKKFLYSKNVIYLGNISKDNIPALIYQFNICIIPYDASLLFNKYCYPMKLFEYFYFEKVVISTPIDELKRLPKYVRICKNEKECYKGIKQLIKIKKYSEFSYDQKKISMVNSWENKINKILDIITNPRPYIRRLK